MISYLTKKEEREESMEKIKIKTKKEKGQSLIEYLILVAIVAIGSVAVLRVVGKNIYCFRLSFPVKKKIYIFEQLF